MRDGQGSTRGDLGRALSSDAPNWWIYRGSGRVLDAAERDGRWPTRPRARRFHGVPDASGTTAPEFDASRLDVFDAAEAHRYLGRATFGGHSDRDVLNRINLALVLGMPLYVTGPPGVGKSALAYSIARELRLGRVLSWVPTPGDGPRAGLYALDGAAEGGSVRLGPLGTAFLPHRPPRVLLVDDIDQADYEFPYEMLRLLREGGFDIPELARGSAREPEAVIRTADPGGTARVTHGRVRSRELPVIVMTSGGDRDLPPALLRRCIQVELPAFRPEELRLVIGAHIPEAVDAFVDDVVDLFVARRSADVDRLLDAVHLIRSSDEVAVNTDVRNELLDVLWRDGIEGR